MCDYGDDTGAPQLQYQGATLPVVQDFKYLGMWVDNNNNVDGQGHVDAFGDLASQGWHDGCKERLGVDRSQCGGA
jgi:hypothetical protein